VALLVRRRDRRSEDTLSGDVDVSTAQRATCEHGRIAGICIDCAERDARLARETDAELVPRALSEQWQYQSFLVTSDNLVRGLNTLGRAGWEVCAVLDKFAGADRKSTGVLMKRHAQVQRIIGASA